MKDFTRDFIKESSIGLPDGAETHFHPWENGRGLTTTTRLSEGVVFHDDIRFREMFGQRTPPRPDVLGHLPW